MTDQPRPVSASQRQKFLTHVHYMRGLSILMIVSLHSMEIFDWSASPGSHIAAKVLLQNSSTLFFFISGYLFRELSHKFEYRDYLLRKRDNVIFPYLFVSIPALIISIFFLRQDGVWPGFYDLPRYQQLALFLISGKHLEPLWFVPAIAIYYLAAPLLVSLDRHPRYYLILPVLVGISCLIGPNGPTGPLQKALYLLPAYIMGMWMSHYSYIVIKHLQRYFFVVVGVMLLMAGAMVYHPSADNPLYMPFKLLNAVAFVYLLGKYCENMPKVLGVVATYSFGIYFVHGYVLGVARLVLDYIRPEAMGRPYLAYTLIGFMLLTAGVTALSMLSIKIVRLTAPRYSRNLVGV